MQIRDGEDKGEMVPPWTKSSQFTDSKSRGLGDHEVIIHHHFIAFYWGGPYFAMTLLLASSRFSFYVGIYLNTTPTPLHSQAETLYWSHSNESKLSFKYMLCNVLISLLCNSIIEHAPKKTYGSGQLGVEKKNLTRHFQLMSLQFFQKNPPSAVRNW